MEDSNYKAFITPGYECRAANGSSRDIAAAVGILIKEGSERAEKFCRESGVSPDEFLLASCVHLAGIACALSASSGYTAESGIERVRDIFANISAENVSKEKADEFVNRKKDN